MTAAEIEADNNRIDNLLTLEKEKKKKKNDYYYSVVKGRIEKEKQHVFKSQTIQYCLSIKLEQKNHIA